MKKLLLSLSLFAALSLGAQTTLYSDDFETPGDWSFSAQTGAANSFLINNVYMGGTFTVLGTTYTIPDVPSQPGTFTNPDQNYLHPVNQIATLNSVNNSSYVTGGSELVEATGNNDISTQGYENIQVSFWRTGGTGGLKFIYSTDGGSNWVTATTIMSMNPTSWEQVTITLPTAAENISNLRIGFRLTETNLGDPAPNHYHSFDEIEVTGDAVSSQTLTHTIQGSVTEFCGGDAIVVDYTGTNGTYNAANEFQLELSDATGSFAFPQTIGTLASTSATGTINGTVPVTVNAGTAYRVRVVCTDNAFTGADNGTDLTMDPKPAAPVVTQNGTTLSSDYANGNQWYMDGSMITGETGQDYTATAGGDYYVVHTSAAGCESDPSNTVTIDFSSIDENTTIEAAVYPNPFNNEITIEANGESRVTVITLTGQIITEFIMDSQEVLSTIEWTAGVYFIKVSSTTGVQTLKVVKK